MQKKNWFLVLKWSVYALLLLFCFVLQTTPGLFELFGTKPLWVMVLAIVVAAFERELPAAVFGCIAGLLCDSSAGRLMGFYGLLLLFACMGLSLLFSFLIRRVLPTVMAFCGLALLCILTIDFFFLYVLPGFGGASLAYLYKILPTVSLSIVVSSLLYLAVRYVHMLAEQHTE